MSRYTTDNAEERRPIDGMALVGNCRDRDSVKNHQLEGYLKVDKILFFFKLNTFYLLLLHVLHIVVICGQVLHVWFLRHGFFF